MIAAGCWHNFYRGEYFTFAHGHIHATHDDNTFDISIFIRCKCFFHKTFLHISHHMHSMDLLAFSLEAPL